MTTPWIAAFGALWFVVLVMGFALIGVMRRTGGVLERAERMVSDYSAGAPALTVIPPFHVLDEADRTISSEEVIKGTTIVLFLESNCGPCRALAADLRARESWPGGVPVVVVAGEEGLDESFELPRDVPVFRQQNRAVARLFRSAFTPHAFVIDEAGVVLDRVLPASAVDIEVLAERQRAGADRVHAAHR